MASPISFLDEFKALNITSLFRDGRNVLILFYRFRKS